MKNTILIVDDAELNREILSEMLESKYSLLEAEDGLKALEMIDEHGDELVAILLDLVMPMLDGFAVLDQLKRRGLIDKIPILVISGEQSVESEKMCFELGVSDFIRKPFNATLVRRRVENVAQLFQYKSSLEDKVQEQTDKLNAQNEVLRNQADRLQKSNERIIDILGAVVESRNLESGEHILRVKGYTSILAKEVAKLYPEFNLTPARIEIIVAASALHDVGKIAIPDSILLKPGRLTQEEFEVMKSHTTRGCEILEQISEAWTEDYGKYSYEICRHHHEKYDGKGYPDHLVGEDIPISAQLVSVADVYDALVNERCYKDAFSKEQAYDMITNGECGMFSPKLMEAFENVRSEFEAYKESSAK